MTGHLELPPSEFQERVVFVSFQNGALMSILKLPPSHKLSEADAKALGDALQQAVSDWRTGLKGGE